MNLCSGWVFRTFSIASAVRTGSVDFSTTILSRFAAAEIVRALDSQYWRSLARPAPRPKVLVGVFTPTKMMSHFLMQPSMSVEKNRFFPRTFFTISASPGSYTGRLSEFHAAILSAFMSTTHTLRRGFFSAITAIVGPPMYPAPMHTMSLFICRSSLSLPAARSLRTSAVP